MKEDFEIFVATCPPKIYTGEEDEQYLIKAVNQNEAAQLFEEEMRRMQKSDQYDFFFLEISPNIHMYYEDAIQNRDVFDYFAETDGSGIVKPTKSELEIIEKYFLTGRNKNLSGHDDNDNAGKKKNWKKIIRENTELLLDFIEENLEDFVGFDPYADTTGFGLQRAWKEKSTYVYSLPSETISALADEIREHPEDFYCEEGEIVDRRIREAEKE